MRTSSPWWAGLGSLLLVACASDEFASPVGQAGEGGASGGPAGGGAAGISGSSGQAGSGASGGPAGGQAGKAGASGGQGGAGQGGAGQAGAGQAGAGGAGGAGAGTGGVGGQGGGCAVVHVSSDTGDDANSGCEAKAPKKSIGAALAAVKGIPAARVLVCSGIYAGPLTLDSAVSLEGNHDCATWTQPASAPTVLLPPDVKPGEESVTLRILPGLEVSVSDLQIEGAFTAEAPARAVEVGAGASATLTRVSLNGGKGHSASAHGAVGLLVRAKGRVNVTDSKIKSQEGQSASIRQAGSAAVVLEAGGTQPSTFTRVQLEGGQGQGLGQDVLVPGYGSVALLTQAPVTLRDSVLLGGSGRVNYGVASAALVAHGDKAATKQLVDVAGSFLEGGEGYVTTPISAAYNYQGYTEGLRLEQATGLVQGSRIYGGDAQLSALETPVTIASLGVHLLGTGDLPPPRLLNNTIVGGNMRHYETAVSARGVLLELGGTAELLFNTILGGTASNQNNPTALFLSLGTNLARFEGNVLGVSPFDGETTNGAFAIYLEGCVQDRFGTMKDNLFLPTFGGVLASNSACDTLNAAYYQPAEFTEKMFSQVVSHNQVVDATCATATDPSACLVVPACETSTDCVLAFFGTLPKVKTLTDGHVLPLSSLPCAVRTAANRASDVAADALGNSRASKTTPGAIQEISGCP